MADEEKVHQVGDESEDDLNNSDGALSQPKRSRDESPCKSSTQSDSLTYNMVPASPPKFMSLEEIIKTAKGIGNMALAHQIAVDGPPTLKKSDLPEKSLEKRVHDVMKQAFWDALSEKLNEEPPDLSQALVLLEEIKEELFSLLLPHSQVLRKKIDEVLDLKLINQQAQQNVLDFHKYADFIISIMAKMCAPARDESIAKLREVKEIVPLYREIFNVLELMKIDMANFTVQQTTPVIQQHAVEYERAQFDEFLKVQTESNEDGLQYTKEWLKSSIDELNILRDSLTNEASKMSEAAAKEESPRVPPLTVPGILSHAYIQLLIWPSHRTLPETVVVDKLRLATLQEEFERINLICSITLLTYSSVGAPIAGLQSLKIILKDHMLAILKDTEPKDVHGAMPSIADQVLIDVQKCLSDHGFPQLNESRKTLLHGQIVEAYNKDHPVNKLIRSRILGFVSQLLNKSDRGEAIQLPASVSTLSGELQHVCSYFMKLVNHNRAVFSKHYSDIINAFIDN